MDRTEVSRPHIHPTALIVMGNNRKNTKQISSETINTAKECWSKSGGEEPLWWSATDPQEQLLVSVFGVAQRVTVLPPHVEQLGRRSR